MLPRSYMAEILGTAVLVFIGCGSVVLGGYGGAGAVGLLPVALAFGMAVTAMAYAVGPVSGAHLNPAVTLAMLVAGRIDSAKAFGYVLSQVLGAFIGAGLLALIVSLKGMSIATTGMGQTVFSAQTGMQAAMLIEFITTFIFIFVIVRVTADGTNTHAGLIIGLTLMAIILVAGSHTGMSANPARSLAPAVYMGGEALSQLWVYVVATLAAGAAAGWLGGCSMCSASASPAKKK